LAMTVADAIFWQAGITIRIGPFPAGSRISGIPVKHEKTRLNGTQYVRCFRASRRIAGRLILQNQYSALLTRLLCSVPQSLIDRGTIRRRIIKTTEIEAAYAIGVKDRGQFDAPLKQGSIQRRLHVCAAVLGP